MDAHGQWNDGGYTDFTGTIKGTNLGG